MKVNICEIDGLVQVLQDTVVGRISHVFGIEDVEKSKKLHDRQFKTVFAFIIKDVRKSASVRPDNIIVYAYDNIAKHLANLIHVEVRKRKY
jgi:hypothetical protein